ncbi:MAG: LPP20 family lipoprotein [Fidelibacterota bacterium]
MINRTFRLYSTFFILHFSLFTVLFAQWGWGEDDAVESVENGAINYSNGWVTATGIGAISPLAQNPGMARATAVRAAKIDAMRNLLEAVMAIRVSSETTVRGAAVENDVIKTQVEGMVKGAKMLDINGDGQVDYSGDIRYLSDTSIEIEMGVHMSGISSVVLPPEGFAPAPATALATESAPAEALPTPGPGTITGLIVDARGFEIRPAMSPRIVDQNGQTVYGPGNFTREYAIKFGVIGYSKNLESAQNDQRVTANPLVVKGIGVEGANNTDVVIASSDAFKVKSADQSGQFLSNCRVMILLD